MLGPYEVVRHGAQIRVGIPRLTSETLSRIAIALGKKVDYYAPSDGSDSTGYIPWHQPQMDLQLLQDKTIPLYIPPRYPFRTTEDMPTIREWTNQLGGLLRHSQGPTVAIALHPRLPTASLQEAAVLTQPMEVTFLRKFLDRVLVLADGATTTATTKEDLVMNNVHSLSTYIDQD